MKTKKKILIVDDDETNLKFLRETLEDDYEIRSAVTGEAGLLIAHEFNPELLLLDIMLPGLSGYEVCETLRNEKENANLKIILISAKAMLAERQRGYEAGADDYITKPFNYEELFSKVSSVLETSQETIRNESNYTSEYLANLVLLQRAEEERVSEILKLILHEDLMRLFSISTSMYSIARHDFKTLISKNDIMTQKLRRIHKKLESSSWSEKGNKEKILKELMEIEKKLKINTLKLDSSFNSYYGGFSNANSTFLTDLQNSLEELVGSYIEKAEFQTIHSRIVTGTKIVFPKNVFYGIVSEIITNSIKHNYQECEIRISLDLVSNHLQIIIEDNGKGIISNLPKKELSLTDLGINFSGLGYLKEIVENVSKGELRFTKSESLQGTEVKVGIPVIGYYRKNEFYYNGESYEID